LADPADALASRRFSILLEEVGAIYDMTIVAVGDGRETTTQTVLNRLDHVIFAIRPGRTSASEVEALQAQLNTFGVSVMGAALVLQAGKSPETSLPVGPESEPPSQTRRPRDEEDPADALVEALVRERERSIKRSGGDRPPAAPKSASIRPVDTPRVEALPAPVEVAESPLPTVAPIETVAPAPMPLLATLSPTTSDEISDQVAVLLETTIDHVLRGFTGVAGTQRFDPGIREVTKYGFVPLVRVKGHKTLGARVFEALKADLDDDGKRQLQSELVDYFDIEPGGRTNERIAGSINRWTAEHYFTRHLAATGREPEVWHVSSPAGTFQALTHSSRATKERIDLLRSEILRRQLDTLNRTLKSAVKAKRSSQVRHLEEQIKDIRTFDIALGWLFEGTTPNARIWYPWKSPEQQPQGWDPNLDEGIRANVAPLQRLGLLVCDVLTEEELIALSPPS
jgi:hypothetical protein